MTTIDDGMPRTPPLRPGILPGNHDVGFNRKVVDRCMRGGMIVGQANDVRPPVEVWSVRRRDSEPATNTGKPPVDRRKKTSFRGLASSPPPFSKALTV